MPMGLISTHYFSYHEIDVTDTDLIEDAFGLNCDFHDVIALFRETSYAPGEALTKRLIGNIRDKIG